MGIDATRAPSIAKLSMGIALTRKAGNTVTTFRWGDMTTSQDPAERGEAKVARPVLADLPPTIFSDPSVNEGISLFFAL